MVQKERSERFKPMTNEENQKRIKPQCEHKPDNLNEF